jgi:acyl carrier protein
MSSSTFETVATELEDFIRERFRVPPDDRSFTRTVRLWDEGYIDSIGVAEMIAFLEKTFRVTISNDVVFSPDFTHINGIARLVMQLRQGASPATEHEGGRTAAAPFHNTGTAA